MSQTNGKSAAGGRLWKMLSHMATKAVSGKIIFDRKMNVGFSMLNIPSRRDLRQVNERLDDLDSLVDTMEEVLNRLEERMDEV